MQGTEREELGRGGTEMKKSAVIMLLLLLGNEVISLAVLCVLGAMGVSKLMTEAAKGGFFS